MTTYSIDRENWEEMLKQIETDLNTDLVGAEIKSNKYGSGTVVAVLPVAYKTGDEPVIVCDIQFETEKHVFYINVGLATKALTVSDEVKDLIADYMTVLDVITVYRNEHMQELNKLAIEKRAEEEKAKKEAAEQAKFEIKLQAYKEKVLRSLNSIKTKAVSLDDDFYTALGWLAKHVGSIYASIPDFAESWFEGRFGTDTPKNVVDSRRKTSGGYAMKWNPSFSVSLKTVENIPAIWAKKSEGKKVINNTEFVFDLIDNYGFKFGKEQDLDAILSTVPNDKLAKFKEGYAA